MADELRRARVRKMVFGLREVTFVLLRILEVKMATEEDHKMTGRDLTSSFDFLPQPLDLQNAPGSLTASNEQEALAAARWALSQLEEPRADFSAELIPSRRLHRAPLLGAFSVHHRVHEYCENKNLQKIIEAKIASLGGQKFLLAINDATNYYAFNVSEFSYSDLRWVVENTMALELVLLIPSEAAAFIFFEDAPACAMAFGDRTRFAREFVEPSRAVQLFLENRQNWTITTSDSEKRWLEGFTQHFLS